MKYDDLIRRLLTPKNPHYTADLREEVVRLLCELQDEDPPHYVIYFMCIGEIGSTLYDSHAECLEDCETEMSPVPVYGIPRADPEDDGEEDG